MRKVVLGRKKASRIALRKTLVSSIIFYHRIKTTPAKAKFVKPFLEKLINLAKVRDLTNMRKIYRLLPRKAAKKMIDDIGPRMKDKKGGFLRITRLPEARAGDGAEQVLIELLIKTKKTKEKPKIKIEKKKQ